MENAMENAIWLNLGHLPCVLHAVLSPTPYVKPGHATTPRSRTRTLGTYSLIGCLTASASSGMYFQIYSIMTTPKS